jgi:hypothetical protein
MYTLSSHDLARARPVMRQVNLLLLALFVGLLAGRSLPAVQDAPVAPREAGWAAIAVQDHSADFEQIALGDIQL